MTGAAAPDTSTLGAPLAPPAAPPAAPPFEADERHFRTIGSYESAVRPVRGAASGEHYEL